MRRLLALLQNTFLPPIADITIQEMSKLKIQETLIKAVDRTITSAGAIVKTLQKIDPKEFQDRLEDKLSSVFKVLQDEFSEPLPEDKTNDRRP